jgi:transcriptional regulator of acetoin/glycerol metabolism
MIYAVNHAENEEIRINDLPATVLEDNSPPINTVSGEKINEIRTIEAMEKVVIENALFKTRNNISRAAEFLGIGKSTLYRKLKEYNISVE